MTFLWASLALFGLIVAGVFTFKFLTKKEFEEKEISSLEQLLERRSENKRYGLPLFLFSLLLSTVFVSWSFDAKYNKLVEKKMYDQKVEVVDSIIQFVIKMPAPPPPKTVDPKPVVEEKIEVPEVKIVDKIKEVVKKTTIDPNFNPNTSFDFDDGPSTSTAQTTDDKIYFPGELSQLPEFPGGKQAETDYLTTTTHGVKKPLRAEKNNESFKVKVVYVIEKDGSITNVELKRGAEELDEASKQKIIKAFLSMPKWTPGKVADEPKRLRFASDLIF